MLINSTFSVSRPSYTTIRTAGETYGVTHVYELSNGGPSPLPAAVIDVAYPQVQRNGAVQLKLNVTEVGFRTLLSGTLNT